MGALEEIYHGRLKNPPEGFVSRGSIGHAVCQGHQVYASERSIGITNKFSGGSRLTVGENLAHRWEGTKTRGSA